MSFKAFDVVAVPFTDRLTTRRGSVRWPALRGIAPGGRVGHYRLVGPGWSAPTLRAEAHYCTTEP